MTVSCLQPPWSHLEEAVCSFPQLRCQYTYPNCRKTRCRFLPEQILTHSTKYFQSFWWGWSFLLKFGHSIGKRGRFLCCNDPCASVALVSVLFALHIHESGAGIQVSNSPDLPVKLWRCSQILPVAKGSLVIDYQKDWGRRQIQWQQC